MTLVPGPHDGVSTAVVFAPSGAATVKPMSESFYQELDSEFPDFAGHVLIQRYSFDTPWSSWERHPKGDEYVYLLAGDTDLILWQDGRETVLRVNQQGSFVVVPRNTWHTARPHAPTSMLFVTPGQDTENAERPD
jgi:mannose-6-phosphate isomerase-like protein (cupin superfamily)